MTLKDTITHVKSILTQNGFEIRSEKEIQYGFQFVVVKDGFAKTLRIFFSHKKGSSIDCSQLGSEPIANHIRSLLSIPVESSQMDSVKDLSSYPKIGLDESGKGDYFGPLVTTAVYVENEEMASNLRKAGVKDCKLLSDSRVLITAEKIKCLLNEEDYYVNIMNPDLYNTIYPITENLNEMLASTHAMSVDLLIGQKFFAPGYVPAKAKKALKETTVIVDQFDKNESRILTYLPASPWKEIVQMPRAESDVAVAAASILARAEFLRYMNSISDHYTVPVPKGASDNVIYAAQYMIKKHGQDILKYVAKLHFKTTEKVLETPAVLNI
jgi:ribonuclease HIII